MNKQQEAIAELKRTANTLFYNFYKFLIQPDVEFAHCEEKILNGSFLKVIYGSSETPVKIHPEKEASLNVILDVLRICITGAPKEENLSGLSPMERLMRSRFPRGLESNAELVTAFESLLNENLEIKISDRPPTTFSFKPCFRTLAEGSMRYINLLNERGDYLKKSEPIGACLECNGIFLKSRTDQTFCSKTCKSASWADRRGKEYFAKKMRENRQSKKELKKHQSRDA